MWFLAINGHTLILGQNYGLSGPTPLKKVKNVLQKITVTNINKAGAFVPS